MTVEAGERKCALCGAVLEGVADDAGGEFRCRHCGCTGRYRDQELIGMFIPGYHRRLMELEALNNELLGEIEMEGMKGPGRDMGFLQKKHLERQDVLTEFAFLTHFSRFIDKW